MFLTELIEYFKLKRKKLRLEVEKLDLENKSLSHQLKKKESEFKKSFSLNKLKGGEDV